MSDNDKVLNCLCNQLTAKGAKKLLTDLTDACSNATNIAAWRVQRLILDFCTSLPPDTTTKPPPEFDLAKVDPGDPDTWTVTRAT